MPPPLPNPRYVLTAPISYHPPVPLASFRSARVTLDYRPTLQYDHAGLLLVLPEAPPQAGSEVTAPPEAEDVNKGTAWVKAGLEAKDGQVYLSVVTKPRGGWCNWSPHSIPGPSTDPGLGSEVRTTVEFVRSKNALHVNHLTGKGEEGRTLLRKIPWVFLGDDDKVLLGDGLSDDDHGGRKIWIGAFAARPDPEGKAGESQLEVRFQGWEIDAGSL